MKEILDNAGVRTDEILLQLVEERIFSGGYEARVCMDKTRTIALVELESIPLRNQQRWRPLLWHEVLHLEDIYKRRFPSMHPVVSDLYPWLCFLWHFSIEGRLEKRVYLQKPGKRR